MSGSSERRPLSMANLLSSLVATDSPRRKFTDEFKAGTLRKPYNVADAAELVRKMLGRDSAHADTVASTPTERAA